jgi:hypothetical protein
MGAIFPGVATRFHPEWDAPLTREQFLFEAWLLERGYFLAADGLPYTEGAYLFAHEALDVLEEYLAAVNREADGPRRNPAWERRRRELTDYAATLGPLGLAADWEW